MTDPKIKEPAKVRENDVENVSVFDRAGKEITGQHERVMIHITHLAKEFIKNHTCECCGHSDSHVPDPEYQFADLLDNNAIVFSCRHCGQEYAAGYCVEKEKEQANLIFSRLDDMNTINSLGTLPLEEYLMKRSFLEWLL